MSLSVRFAKKKFDFCSNNTILNIMPIGYNYWKITSKTNTQMLDIALKPQKSHPHFHNVQ